MRDLPADLRQLALLNTARAPAAEYYAPLLDSDDAVLKIGAWCALLEREAVGVAQYRRVIDLATYGAIQSRAFNFFQANWEHDFAAEVAGKVATSEASAAALAMRAELACDDVAAIEAQRYRFLATGRFDALAAMVQKSEHAAGWRAAVAVAARALVLNPHEPLAAQQLLQQLYSARQLEMLEAVLELLAGNGLHPYLTVFYTAAARLLANDALNCLVALRQLSGLRPARPDVMLRTRPLLRQINAEAIEKTGDYRRAYEAYVELNSLDGGKAVNPDDFTQLILSAAAREVPVLPADPNTNHVVMTGFPRSGTTLLENALAAHPRIETFEEIPSTAAMELYLAHALPEVTTPAQAAATYLTARERYYDEEIRRSHKPGATVFIDKLPMRSAEAGFMAKIFPDKRYIFSIRHPFDVVLSCFKQHFGRNIAMEHFRTFEGAVKLYDFTMRQWFGVFTLDDKRVHYLRYEDLVTSFEPSLRGALDFLGVEWDDRVLDFASAAEQRSVRTPSYQKVRQGLTIGIQTQWRNYGFLFQSEAAAPLYHWAEFFGYSTT